MKALIITSWLALTVFASLQLASATTPTKTSQDGLRKATFAGGCFWCMEPPFERLDGVVKVTAGYTGGDVANPTYEQVSAGGTGHAESVEVVYNPDKIRYAKLLEVFWHNIDPTQHNRQFCDVGEQYRSAIFYHSEQQKAAAEASKRKLEASPRFKGKTLYTQIVPAGPFYAAEDYHQDYARKNPVRYKFYRWNCGRDQRLEDVWGHAPEH